MEKRVIVLLIILVFLPLVSALGISPAKKYVNFKPNLELEYSFKIFADSKQKIELYAAGEFSDLVTFDKKELVGGGSFKVRIKLPDKIEKPGEHRILIGAREKAEEEEMLGTVVAVQAPIVVFVPYPGKYAEVSLSANNANVGEPIKFEVNVKSLGNESIIATTNIEIYNANEEKIETLYLGTKKIDNQTSAVFKKTLDTKNYQPGNYEALAIVDYQEGVAKANKKFRIGHLFVNITNYTKEVIKKGIQPFEIEIESLWNDKIDNVYAKVFVNKQNHSVITFQTPSAELNEWEKKTLLGYIDTDKLKIGRYDLKIVVHYVENSTAIDGKLDVVRKSQLVFYLLIIGIIIAVISLGIGVYLWRRHAKKKK